MPTAMAMTFKALADMGLAIDRITPLMTSNVSKLLKFHSKGHLACGFDADLLVVDAQFNINSVMANGVWHILRGEQLKRGLFENEST